ncbi:TetR/AcrR family transcriptional regulator C-terminal domain-containing protein [Nocardia sp. NRRL WC-3656]|uniref:TetR/AcrR family transcriptional regulator C-terminal domain-containing protein n=1 Tax=Nocardia sp. NRRL WC-3656 TaxID=1463824 RepID=UPI0006917D47|nr:TetR/AcrR family transcriptional regulator C-terminal domain-containing protein [Nocardia sp. NRRL WC-3656]
MRENSAEERPRRARAAGERSSAGDPARTLELLWRQPGRASGRGPRQRSSVDEVVAAAVDIADAQGLEALTMRAVAAKLGLTPMATYTYVPGKAELLDLMLDAVYGRMPRTDLAGKSWRERVCAVAQDNRSMLARHRWVAGVPTTRPPLGPGLAAKYDHELSAFDGLGLSDVEMDAALTYLLGFVTAVARIAIDTDRAAADSGLSDREWWERTAPVLEQVFDPQRYPLAARVGSAAGQAHDSAYSAEHAWNFGLARVLDGLAVLIERSGVSD